jgi:hypothetical protein
VILVESLAEHREPIDGQLTLVIPEKGCQCRCIYDDSVIDGDNLQDYFTNIALIVINNPGIKLTDINIINDLLHSESNISQKDLDDFGF